MTKRKTSRASARALVGYTNPLPPQQPCMRRSTGPQLSVSGGNLRIRNTESFFDLPVPEAGQGFNKWYSKDFNPGSNSLWCGGIARCHALYRIHSLVFRYVPFLSTGNNGNISMCAIYTAEDRENWFKYGSSNDASMYAQFAQGPIWAGGGLSSMGDRASSGMPMDVVCDMSAVHRRVPWHIVDPGLVYPLPPATPNYPEIDNAVAVSLGLAYNANTTLQPGKIYVSYDIEFCNPIPPVVNVTFLKGLTGGGGVWTADPTAPPPRSITWQDETAPQQESGGV